MDGKEVSGWVQTYTGRKVHPLLYAASDWSPVDAAESLSWLFRWGRASQRRISVAQHSLVVSDLASQLALVRGWGEQDAGRTALAGLLHDASEYILGDLPAPLKHGSEFAWYRDVEAHVQGVIYGLHGFACEPSIVKEADQLARYLERAQLFDYHHIDWHSDPPGNLPHNVKIPHYGTATPEVVAQQFLRRYERLVTAVGVGL